MLFGHQSNRSKGKTSVVANRAMRGTRPSHLLSGPLLPCHPPALSSRAAACALSNAFGTDGSTHFPFSLWIQIDHRYGIMETAPMSRQSTPGTPLVNIRTFPFFPPSVFWGPHHAARRGGAMKRSPQGAPPPPLPNGITHTCKPVRMCMSNGTVRTYAGLQVFFDGSQPRSRTFPICQLSYMPSAMNSGAVMYLGGRGCSRQSQYDSTARTRTDVHGARERSNS